ncbi:MAG: PA2779 family protein [Candidatus Kariarchaeaceae archaeon]|jgi:hypothetical protein
MKFIRKKVRFVSLLMMSVMLSITVPCQSLLAAIVPTETIIDANNTKGARDYLKNLISRDDVRELLISHGIDHNEAKARVDSLSDSEVIALADRIEKLPAGGDAIGVIVGASLIVFLVLLLTDILGYTDVFPFVKKKK